jgi:hypothetical protein
MRQRDLVIVLVSVLALALAWSRDGNLSIRRGFAVPLTDPDLRLTVAPKPIVSDLDGDGKPDTLLLTSSDFLAIYRGTQVKRSYENSFIGLQSVHTVALSATCVGLGNGYIERYNASKEGESNKGSRKQVIAAVTNDYRVTLYDSTLMELWSTLLVAPLESNMVPSYAAVTVLPSRVYTEDVGMVIVGVHTAYKNTSMPEALSYFALDGKTGEVRWRHSSGEFSPDPDSVQANAYKMSEEQLKAHVTEQDWSMFRGSIVGALPHSFSHVWDLQMHPFEFFRAKGRRKHQADRTKPGYRNTANDRRIQDKSHRVGQRHDDFGELGELLTSNQRHHNHHSRVELRYLLEPNVLVAHHDKGLEIVHLYTGRTLAKVGPLHKGHATYHDLNDDYHIDAVEIEIGARQIMHHRHGVDEFAVCLGKVSTGAPTSYEPVFNTSICHAGGFLHSWHALQHFLRGEDTVNDESLPDPLSALGNLASGLNSDTVAAAPPIVVQRHIIRGRNVRRTRRDAVFYISSGLVTSVDPLGRRARWRTETDSVFDPTAMHKRAEGAADTRTKASQDDSLARVFDYPHLCPYSAHYIEYPVRTTKLMRERTDSYVLAVGNAVMTAISVEDGSAHDTLSLHYPPIAPCVVADVNGDGVNDVVITTRKAYLVYFGFVHRGTHAISILLLSCVLLVGFLFLVRQTDPEADQTASLPTKETPRAKVGKRSTD